MLSGRVVKVGAFISLSPLSASAPRRDLGVPKLIVLMVYDWPYLHKNYYYELSLYLSILSIWDIFFSPFGGTRMMMLPLYIVIIFSISSNSKQKF